MAYLISLLAASGCLAAIDHRFTLFFWRAPRAEAAVVSAGTAFFLAWDFAAIGAGIFEGRESPLMTGILLAPELPLEEPAFLAFFCYAAMVLFAVAERVLVRRGALARESAGRRALAHRPAAQRNDQRSGGASR